ncbi:hypothetical protein SAMN02745136_01479 [Anaerocolumna jejuensis DSM 15929]|uniref:Uncharacterized protein n=1 Tax=Anaerocolumna jejuensis DSM 15929 TaxID=1121322 RepID=A0A1M6NW41_9FIRM|nr:hypothetical protein [Anaerocolumna jejuensis]SHJ99851.1 hypothetical protein SAMN02745136_01479 [Anaerocolumna jejuensis DSM 15929]
MTNTKNSKSKNSTKNKTTGKMQDVAVNTTNTSTESSAKDLHTMSQTSGVSSDDSERRDGPGGN